MRIKCNKTDLLQAVQIVAKAVSNKQQTPILSGIYLNANENKLELQATNYEISFICQIEAEIEEPGSLVLSGKYLQEVSRKFPGETVNILTENNNNIAILKSNMTKFTLRSMPVEDFPKIKKFPGESNLTIRDITLAKLIKKTSYSCSSDETRPIFTGCYFRANESDITMAATNTHRLAVKKDSIEGSAEKIEVIIPAKVLNEIIHFVDTEAPSDINITCSKKLISFEYGNIYMASRLIEGQYPDYTKVIPNSFATHAKISTAELAAAVDRVALISRSDEYNIMRFEFSNNSIHISSNNPDIGNAEETISANIDGPDINIAFNAAYIIDVLKNTDGDNITFALNKPLNPVAIKEENDGTFIYILTPVRTSY